MSTSKDVGRQSPRALDAEILRLALPAFLALVAEPLFLLADAAVVGHLGTRQLAGLGIAAACLQTAIGLCVFLAYGTTASVARRLGAGDLPGALRQGIDGVWLAVAIGVVVTLLGVLATEHLVALFGQQPGTDGGGEGVADYAATYLRIALLGTTPLLVMLATTGILRGLQDTRTPLVVAVAGNLANVALNVLLVYGAGLGIAGSALGSVLAQVGCAVALTWVVVRAARAHGTPLAPRPAGVLAAARAGVPLLLRTLTLRLALLATVFAVASMPRAGGDGAAVATHQLAFTVWTFLAFVLDAIAIAAQAITGRYLGAGDVAGTRSVTDRMVRWGWASGLVTGVLLAAVSPWLGWLFTSDADVHRLLVPVLLVVAVTQPLAGVVFVLDGVLIGAGDGRYLARTGLLVLIGYLPLLALAAGLATGPTAGLTWIWVAFSGGFMVLRGVVLVRRSRGDAWLVTGG